MKLSTKILTISLLPFFTSAAFAKEIKTNTAQMQAMDKITGRVKVIEVPVNGSVDFGTFSILVRDCQTRPPEEMPENYAFVDIVDNNTDGSKFNIFRGWMMSSTPALNAVEHPIYDVWLLKCINTEVDKKGLLSAEELEIRNNIPKPAAKEDKIKEGEPTNLLPNLNTAETGTNDETMAETEEQIIVKGLVPDETYNPENNNIVYEELQPKEENIIINTDIIEQIKSENPNVSIEDGVANPLINLNGETGEGNTADEISGEIIEDPAELPTAGQPAQPEEQSGESAVPNIAGETNAEGQPNETPAITDEEYSDFDEMYNQEI